MHGFDKGIIARFNTHYTAHHKTLDSGYCLTCKKMNGSGRQTFTTVFYHLSGQTVGEGLATIPVVLTILAELTMATS